MFFNSGCLIIGKDYQNEHFYKALVRNITPEFFENCSDTLADEPILNTFFEYKINPLPVQLNCPVHLLAEGTVKTSVVSVHFTGKNKPWKIASWMRLLMRKGNYRHWLLQWGKAYFSGTKQ
jgi:lipopolysaccharide biosynthesis glycosyltransferase